MSFLERVALCIAGAGVALALGCQEAAEPPAPPPPRHDSAPAPPETPAAPPAETAAEAPAAAPAAVDLEAGRADYEIYCASCHGLSGGGDGPIAATLDPRPARHNDGRTMNVLTDAYLFRTIKEGGRAVGKSDMMAAWGGSLSDQQIHNLVAFIRSLADPPYPGASP